MNSLSQLALSEASDVDVGDRIYRTRTLRGLSQNELTRRLGCAHGAVSGWERGKAKPTYDKLLGIAKILRVRPDFFFGFENRISAALVRGGAS